MRDYRLGKPVTKEESTAYAAARLKEEIARVRAGEDTRRGEVAIWIGVYETVSGEPAGDDAYSLVPGCPRSTR